MEDNDKLELAERDFFNALDKYYEEKYSFEESCYTCKYCLDETACINPKNNEHGYGEILAEGKCGQWEES